MAEAIHLQNLRGVPADEIEFLPGTVVLASGLMMLLIAGRDWECCPWLSKIGGLTLGVYVMHPLFVRLLQPIGDRLKASWWEVMFPFLVYGLSLILTLIFARLRLPGRVVI